MWLFQCPWWPNFCFFPENTFLSEINSNFIYFSFLSFSWSLFERFPQKTCVSKGLYPKQWPFLQNRKKSKFDLFPLDRLCSSLAIWLLRIPCFVNTISSFFFHFLIVEAYFPVPSTESVHGISIFDSLLVWNCLSSGNHTWLTAWAIYRILGWALLPWEYLGCCFLAFDKFTTLLIKSILLIKA